MARIREEHIRAARQTPIHDTWSRLGLPAARTGEWPAEPGPDFCAQKIQRQQHDWEKVHRARAWDHNVYVLLCNAAGPSTQGLEGVVANHAGTVMAVDPKGEVFLRTAKTDFTDEVVTVELKKDTRKVNHGPARNRRLLKVVELLRRTAG